MSKIFCKLGEVPKGKKRGSMKECAELKQINFYGEKKVDKKIIDSILDAKNNTKKSLEKSLDNMKIKYAGLMGKKKNITVKVEKAKNDKEKKTLEKEKKSIEDELEKLKDKMISTKEKIKKMENIENKKMSRSRKNSKKNSKRNSKKNSKKKYNIMKGGNINLDQTKSDERDAMVICE